MSFLIPEHTASPTPAITQDMIDGVPVPPVLQESKMADIQDLKKLNSELKAALGRTQYSLYHAYEENFKLECKVASLQLLAYFLGLIACGFLVWALTVSN